MKETNSLKKLLLFSSTIIILTITAIVSYYLIISESENFNKEIKRNEIELLQGKKLYLENRLKLILKEINNDEYLIKQYEVQKVENFVKMLSKVISKNLDKNKYETKELLNYYDNEDEIHGFALDSKGILFWNPKSPNFEGDNFIHIEDINNFAYIKEIIKKAKEGDNSFTEFTWYTSNEIKISTNIVYARYISSLDLIVAAYSSKDLIEDKIKQATLKYISSSSFKNKVFLSVDYLKSYRMQGSFTDALSGFGDKKYLDIIRQKSSQDIIAKQYLNEGFKNIHTISLDNKDDNFLLYSTILPQWRWMITIGEDLKTLYTKQKLQEQKAIKNLNQKILKLILLSTIVAIFFFILSIFLSKKIGQLLIDYQKKADTESDKYQALFEYSNDSFLLANEEYNIIDVNKKAFNLSKLNKEEILNSKFNQFFPEIDFQKVKEEKSGYERTKFLNARNEEKIVEFTYVWISIEQEKVIFASIRDITERMGLIKERKEHEQILIQQSKMAAMGEMIGNIAHQWRQPLSQISGLFMDISSAYSYKELDQKYLDNVVDEADNLIEYMSHTIDDFKNFFPPPIKLKKSF
jgi:PAS domain S-box-containing protein